MLAFSHRDRAGGGLTGELSDKTFILFAAEPAKAHLLNGEICAFNKRHNPPSKYSLKRIMGLKSFS